MTSSHQPNDLPDNPDNVGLAEPKRRVLLARLGQGATAASLLAPLASRAGGTHKITNPVLPGGFGYCSVSGFQSAAVSGSPAPTVCSAYAPGHFVTSQALTYTGGNLGISGSVNANKLRDALNAKYGVGVFTSANVAPLLGSSAPAGGYVAVPGSGVVLIWTSSNTSTALTRNNWPAVGLDGLTQFSTLFPVGTPDARPLLRVLYDGVLTTNPANANCWLGSAYLTVYNGTPSYLPVGFDTTYVRQQAAGSGSGTDTYKFFAALCVTP